MAPLPTYSIAKISDYLTTGFGRWFGASPHSYNMGKTGVGANSGTLLYNYSGFASAGDESDLDGLTADRRLLVDHAFDYLGEILGINFVPTTSQGDEVDFFFMDAEPSSAWAATRTHESGNGQSNHKYVDYSIINVSTNWFYGSSEIGSHTYSTFIHEILHALGLGHSGPYNGYSNFVTDDTDPNFGNNSNIYLNDSWQLSIMSYFSQRINTFVSADYAFQITPMAADLHALRALYGDASAFLGDTVYGFDTNILPSVSAVLSDLAVYATRAAFTLIDDGGIDTVNFSGYIVNQRIDLTIATETSVTGTISDIGGRLGNMTLAVGTIIENAIGGSGNDTITGNTARNLLRGNAGNDAIDGAGGFDTAVYSGLRSEYRISYNRDGTVTIAHSGSDGTDTLRNVEQAQFSNRTFDLERRPDLIAEDLVLGSTSWLAGDRVTAGWNIVNQGDAVAASSRSSLYISTDRTISASDTLLATDPQTGTLGPGEIKPEFRNGQFEVPTGLAPGTYYVGVLADTARDVSESDEANNVSNVVRITIHEGPDLIAEDLVLGSTSWLAGDRVTAGWNIVNQGDAVAASSRSSLYISTDRTISASDTLLATDPQTGTLGPGEIKPEFRNGQFEVPTGLAPGTYYVGVLADAARDVSESDEANNVSNVIEVTILEGSDLIAEDLVLGSTSWLAGDRVTAGWNIVNQGDAVAASSRSSLYISTDRTISASDTLLATDPQTGTLGPGEIKPEFRNGQFEVPTGLAPGTYYVGVLADAARDVSESDEANNVSNVIEVTIKNIIRGTPGPDILIGTAADDIIYPLAGDDEVRGSFGSDYIDGGEGHDTVVYNGQRHEFRLEYSAGASGNTGAGQQDIEFSQGHIKVVKPDGGFDILYGIERIELTDGSYIYDIDSPNLSFGYRIYQASFNRTPDEDGVLFWIGVLDSLDDKGWSQYDKQQFLAEQFIESLEFTNLFGTNPTNEQYIDAMYSNVLDRLPDKAGYDFWIGGMERGLTPEDILIAFTESDENVALTASDLDPGVWVV